MNLRDELVKQLSAEQQQTLQMVASAAGKTNTVTYLVGGVVRDLLLARAIKDLDIAIVGNAITLGKQLVERYGGELLTHARFNTATWETPAQLELDLVTARSEQYAHSAALPDVQPGSMDADLQRRDFTINTLAIRLDGEQFGTLVDRFDGRSDLELGLIRILHADSFIDDPTRIFRAVRYEQRLGFALEPDTSQALQSGLPGIELLTPDRLRHEFERLLLEQQAPQMLARLEQLGVLSAIHSELCWQAVWAQDFEAIGADASFNLRLLVWLSHFELAVQRAVLVRLGVAKAVLNSAEIAHTIQMKLNALAPTIQPSTIETILRHHAKDSDALTVAQLRLAGQPAHWLETYLAEWQHVRPTINGNDLRQIGLRPGPHFRVILDRLKAAWLDGEVTDSAEERALLQTLLPVQSDKP